MISVRQILTACLAALFLCSLFYSSAQAQSGSKVIVGDPPPPSGNDHWSDTFGVSGVTGGGVYAMATDSEGNLYIGGDFTHVDDDPMPNLAKFTVSSQTWSAIGGLDLTDIKDLVTGPYDYLYVASPYLVPPPKRSTPESIDFNGVTNWIAVWDPVNSIWSQRGNIGGQVLALALDEHTIPSPGKTTERYQTDMVIPGPGSFQIYAGGYFNISDGAAADYVAAWDGNSWWELDPTAGPDGAVHALVRSTPPAGKRSDSADKTEVLFLLYAGGEFALKESGTKAEAQPLDVNIAVWDGGTWQAVGTGIDGHVKTLEADSDGKIYAGGEFATAGGVAAANVAVWDGINWSPLGDGLNNIVHDLLWVAPDQLYAGGEFTASGSTTVNYVARWTGSQWVPLGSGVADPGGSAVVTSLEKGSVYVGGVFETAGGKASSGIGLYDNTQLPLELVEFSATITDGEVVLKWETEMEADFAGFVVEHKIPSENESWREVAFVDARGLSQSGNRYSYSIDNFEVGINLFRLKLVDLDGTVRYSDILETMIPLESEYNVEPAFPNPFRQQATVRLTVASEQHIRASMYDLFGREVRVVLDEVVPAHRRVSLLLDTADLAAGAYVLRVRGDSFEKDEKVIVLK